MIDKKGQSNLKKIANYFLNLFSKYKIYFLRNRSLPNFRIIQCSSPHTGSTVLANHLCSIFTPGEKVHFQESDIGSILVTKSHVINIDRLRKNYRFFELYFIASEREGHRAIDEKYRNLAQLEIFQYEEICTTETYSVEQMCQHCLTKLKKFFPESVWPDTPDENVLENMIERIKSMNKLNKEIKGRPFSYVDEMYGLHGSHCNRKHKTL